MGDIGGIDSLLISNQVKLIVKTGTGTTRTAAATAPATKLTNTSGDQFLAVADINVDQTYPEQRINAGLDRAYFHGAPDISLSFTVKASSDIYTHFFGARGTRSTTTGQLPIHNWQFLASDVAGSNEKYLSFYAQLIQCSVSREGDQPGTPLVVRARLRIIDKAVTTG